MVYFRLKCYFDKTATYQSKKHPKCNKNSRVWYSKIYLAKFSFKNSLESVTIQVGVWKFEFAFSPICFGDLNIVLTTILMEMVTHLVPSLSNHKMSSFVY
jgi:hypothetical protein